MTTMLIFVEAVAAWQKAGRPDDGTEAKLEAMRAELAGRLGSRMGVALPQDAAGAARVWRTKTVRLS